MPAARTVLGLAAAALVGLIGLAPPAAAAAVPVFRLTDPRLGEVSGLGAGITSPGVLYVHDDSGDSARFFALDAGTGRVLAEYDVPGATNVDWEDLAVAPDAAGTPSVWLADIGDNSLHRDHVTLYRVDEPHVDRSRAGLVLRSGRPDVWQLRYPGHPQDAESLAVSPHGVPYIVTKSLDGRSTVYRAPTAPSPSVRELTAVGSIRFVFTGTPGPWAPIGQLAATGASFSADGTVLAVRTYTDAYVWRVTGGDVGGALRTDPARVALPQQPQGEGICVTRGALWIDSEKLGSGVYRVPLPAAPTSDAPSSGAPSSGASSSGDSSPVSSASPSSPLSPVVSPASSPVADSTAGSDNHTSVYVLGGLAALAMVGVAVGAEAVRRRS